MRNYEEKENKNTNLQKLKAREWGERGERERERERGREGGREVITYIFNSYFHHNLWVLMLNFSLYDAYYHLKMKVSSI